MGPGPQPLSRIAVAWAKGRVAFVRVRRDLMEAVAGPVVKDLYSAASASQSVPLAGWWLVGLWDGSVSGEGRSETDCLGV